MRKPLKQAALDILARTEPTEWASKDPEKRAAAASMAGRIATEILARPPAPPPYNEQAVASNKHPPKSTPS
jgi:hypothetical protein